MYSGDGKIRKENNMGLEMTNMKIKKKSGKKSISFTTSSGGYPYGLQISLDKDVIKKLQLEA